jgi:hypothetical protein
MNGGRQAELRRQTKKRRDQLSFGWSTGGIRRGFEPATAFLSLTGRGASGGEMAGWPEVTPHLPRPLAGAFFCAT